MTSQRRWQPTPMQFQRWRKAPSKSRKESSREEGTEYGRLGNGGYGRRGVAQGAVLKPQVT